MFQDLKDSKKWSSENTKIPRPSKMIQHHDLFKRTFVLIDFTSVLKVLGDQRFIKIPSSHFPSVSTTIEIDGARICAGRS